MTLNNITVAGSFDDIKEQAIKELTSAQFVIVGDLDYHKHFLQTINLYLRKHAVLVVDAPQFSLRMLSVASFEGEILPACVSIVEKYPGEVNISIANQSEVLADSHSDTIFANIAREMGALLSDAMNRVVMHESRNSHLITSWH